VKKEEGKAKFEHFSLQYRWLTAQKWLWSEIKHSFLRNLLQFMIYELKIFCQVYSVLRRTKKNTFVIENLGVYFSLRK